MKEESLLKEKTLYKVKTIINQNQKKDLLDDKIVKCQIKAIFTKEYCLDKITFPDIKQPHILLLSKLIELIDLMFKMTEAKREECYKENMKTIKNKNIYIALKQLANLENFNFTINSDIINLFNTISHAFDKKESFTISEYIDSIFNKLAFSPNLSALLKYQIFNYITRYFLSKFGIVLIFRENEINVTDKTSIKLIVNLFQKEKISNDLLVQSIIILNYNSLRDIIVNYDFNKIIEAIKSVSA